MTHIPYPFTLLRGRLRLIGMQHHIIERIIAQVKESDSLDRSVVDILSSEDNTYSERYRLLVDYEIARRNDSQVKPLVLVLEGASATGKSMLALDMINNLGTTRIISTDTIRQVLRGIYSPSTHPELYCHTYQAYEKRQLGPESLDPVVRGYIAQCELITPTIETMTSRILEEGAEALIEGVHVIPGALEGLSKSVIEVLINPPPEIHREMFLTKHSLAGLKSVTSDEERRVSEYKGARKIQEFMIENAHQNDIDIIEFSNYEQLEQETCQLVLERMKGLIKS